MESFVNDELPKRHLGNSCVLVCGEINGVKYSRKEKTVEDAFGLRNAIQSNVKVILNPGHDRMTRSEMPKKREFLSKRGRLVVSVWNKGRKDKSGKIRDGSSPAWSVFHNGAKINTENNVELITNIPGVEIGVLDLRQDLKT